MTRATAHARAAPSWRQALPWLPATLALGFAVGLVVRQTWVADDAFITLRTVEAALRGDGLVWNPGQRVQAYTHPLWMGLLVAARAVVGDAWWAAALLGWTFTAVALWLLVRLARDPERTAFALFGFALSKPLLHYSTSGLENPLAHALLLGMALLAAPSRPSLRTLRGLGLLGALLVLTRVDLGLAGAPVVLWVLHRVRGEPLRKLLSALAPGVIVLAGWEAFSLVYYGALVPNTAYAKLTTGVPLDERLAQGVDYLLACSEWDPWTSILIVAGVAVAAVRGRPVERAWALGVAAYVGYVVWIGGDFMVGRFLSAPAVISLGLLARVPLPRRRRSGALIAAAAMIFALSWITRAPWHLPSQRGVAWTRYGVADEQSFWFADTGLFWDAPEGERRRPPRHGRVAMGRAMAPGEVTTFGMVGFYGYGAEDRGIIVDPIGLTDPLLARLPAVRDQSWRPGHLHRRVPEGYVETVRTGTCQMNDADLCTLWRHLHRITEGALWSSERIASIWQLQSGQLDGLIDDELHRRPSLVARSAAALAGRPAHFGDSGIEVPLEGRDGPACVRARLQTGATYGLMLTFEGQIRCETTADLRHHRPTGLSAVEVRCDRPFDRLLVEPRTRPRVRDRHAIDRVTLASFEECER